MAGTGPKALPAIYTMELRCSRTGRRFFQSSCCGDSPDRSRWSGCNLPTYYLVLPGPMSPMNHTPRPGVWNFTCLLPASTSQSIHTESGQQSTQSRRQAMPLPDNFSHIMSEVQGPITKSSQTAGFPSPWILWSSL